MPIYHRCGNVARKKHTTFRKEDDSLYWEELISTLGFSGIYSTLYRLQQPTRVESLRELSHVFIPRWEEGPRQAYHFFTDRAEKGGDLISARRYWMHNSDVAMCTASFDQTDDRLYRNARADEILFVHRGTGVLHSEYGLLPFEPGDYVVAPRGVIYQLKDLSADNQFFVIESNGPVQTPKRYRNAFGQHLEHSPFCERDFKLPQLGEPVQTKGEVTLMVKSGDRLFEYMLDHHPFDVVGWDGYYYPWAINIKDFEPIVGRIHQPPPVHQIFEAPGFVVCNFVPRLFDFHPEAVPAPYFHQNVDSDEVLYYVEGNFMSRKGIESGSITLHPGDIPHGPQPGKIEASIGVKEVYEYAVMVDTFRPLDVTSYVRSHMDPDYPRSWLG